MAIKLGGGGGGSASQINEVVLLNDTADLVTLSDGRKYLKGGVFETTLSTYPDASISFQYLGTSFSVGSQDTAPQGITWDGTHFWVIGYGTDAVYKYTSAGVYTGTSFSVASQETFPSGITWDGTHFWVVGDATDKVYKYGDVIGIPSVSDLGGQNYVRVL
jgi:hypothetical protein